MDKLDQLLSLYTALIGVNGSGDPSLDDALAAYLEDVDLVGWRLTSSIDDSLVFLKHALPGWQIYELCCGPDMASRSHADDELADSQPYRWCCTLCRSNEAGDEVEGYGRAAPIAILAAVITQLISDILTHWKLIPRTTGLRSDHGINQSTSAFGTGAPAA